MMLVIRDPADRRSGRKAWLFAGSELAGQRAAMVISLVQSARLHGHDPWVYLRDVLERLLAHPTSKH
jgi:transposase